MDTEETTEEVKPNILAGRLARAGLTLADIQKIASLPAPKINR